MIQDPRIPKPKSNTLKIVATVFLVIGALLFTTGMRAFGKALSGGGMGSRFFLFLVSGPEGLWLLVWPILAGFLPWTRNPKIALTVVLLSLAHPILATFVLKFEGVEDDVLKSIWKSARPVIYVFSVLYFLPSTVGLLSGLRGAVLILKDLLKSQKEVRRPKVRK